MTGAAELDHPVGILGIVVVERALRGEGVIDAIAEGVTQLVLGHAAMQRQRSDEVNIIDTGCCGHIENLLDDALPNVGLPHGGQRQRDVVEGDRQLHAGLEQLGQGIVIDRFEQRVTNRRFGVGQARERLGRVDHPGAIGWELFEPEVVAVVEQQRRCLFVDVEDEARSR